MTPRAIGTSTPELSGRIGVSRNAIDGVDVSLAASINHNRNRSCVRWWRANLERDSSCLLDEGQTPSTIGHRNKMDLIHITARQIGDDTVQTVSARDLHAFLGVRQDFNKWARTQIRRSRLVEGREYLTYLEVVQMPSGAKQLTQHAIAIESAKHIAMMSGTEKGFEVREYFINCERKAKAAHAQIDNSLYARALEAETREAKSFAAAQLGSRLMLLRKSEKAALQEDVALMREHMQLRLALGLGGSA